MNMKLPPLMPYRVPMTGTRTYSKEPEKGLVWDEAVGTYRVASKDLDGLPIVRKRPMPFWQKLALVLLSLVLGLAAVAALVFFMVQHLAPVQVVQSAPVRAVTQAPAPAPLKPADTPVVQAFGVEQKPTTAPSASVAPAPTMVSSPIAQASPPSPSVPVVATAPVAVSALAAQPAVAPKPSAAPAPVLAAPVVAAAPPKPNPPAPQASIQAKPAVVPTSVAPRPPVPAVATPAKVEVPAAVPAAAAAPKVVAPAPTLVQSKPVEVVTSATLQRGWPVAVEGGAVKYFDGANTKIYKVGDTLPNGEKIVDVDEGSATYATDSGVRQIRSSKLKQ